MTALSTRATGSKRMTLQSDARLVRYERRSESPSLRSTALKKRNAFNVDLVPASRSADGKFDADSHAYAAVLCGAGKAFSSGADGSRASGTYAGRVPPAWRPPGA